MRAMIAMLTALGALGTTSLGTAAAQEDPRDAGWGMRLGVGGLTSPSYEGDDAMRLSLLPSVRVTYGDVFSASVEEGVRYRWINTPVWRAGPIGRIAFPRDEDGSQLFAVTGDDTDDLLGLGDVDASIELGGFVERDIGPITISAEARQAVSGHDGFVADLEARWRGRTELLGAPVFWSVGPRARFVNDEYNSAYFGVDAAQSAASGLPVYTADGGLHSFGLGASAIVPLSRDGRWAAAVVAGVDRLDGDAGSSPLVELRGDDDQARFGVFISRRLF
ncbi:MAG: hypothetical protein GC206_05065 [Alphaproteobacteria bacterium]|nr:hypothetical protein [Alphaproteobacteria bacterium]